MAAAGWRIPTSDDELLEIFFDEVGELLENIDRNMNTWMNHPGDKKSLTEIRRSFHTLKGSGRMVKALDLSDMAWKIENMLNQAIAETVPISDSMVELVVATRTQIPRMLDAFKNRRAVSGSSYVARLMKDADALAAGRKPAQEPAPLAATAATGDRQHFTPYELNLKLERFMQRADEALHRSEMALQQARRIETLSQAAHGVLVAPDHSGEAGQIDEHVDPSSKDLANTRLESRGSPEKPMLHQSDPNVLVGRQVEAKLTSLEHLLVEIKRDVQENRHTVDVLRRFGWWAIVTSALVGGLVATRLPLSIPFLG